MGDDEAIKASCKQMHDLPVDWDLSDHPVEPLRRKQTTLAESTTISGPGTFMGKATRTISFAPSYREGWWLNRADLSGSLPTRTTMYAWWNIWFR